MAIDLPDLSAKISSLHGTHRSQYIAEATTEVILWKMRVFMCVFMVNYYIIQVIHSITAMLHQSSLHESECLNKQ